MIDLSGRHVFISGGSRGIGAAAAALVAQAGASVSINYRARKDKADEVASQIRNAGGAAEIFRADMSDEAESDRAFTEAASRFGPLNGLVVSAGIFEGRAIESMDAAFWDRTMAQNLRSTFLAVKGAAARMSGGGSMVIYTSTAGQRGSAEYSAYASSKAAQIMFMRSMAKELGPRGIRVNCIAPAWTETDMAAPSLDAMGRERVAKEFVLGRIALPDDVAGPTLFLLSDLARFVTGITLTVDGGADMRG